MNFRSAFWQFWLSFVRKEGRLRNLKSAIKLKLKFLQVTEGGVLLRISKLHLNKYEGFYNSEKKGTFLNFHKYIFTSNQY